MTQQDRKTGTQKKNDDKFRGRKRRMFIRKKVCRFCKENIIWIDYKNIDVIKQFMSDRGKIIPGTVTGTCAKHQRQLGTAIKRLRHLALLPYSTAHYKAS